MRKNVTNELTGMLGVSYKHFNDGGAAAKRGPKSCLRLLVDYSRPAGLSGRRCVFKAWREPRLECGESCMLSRNTLFDN